MPGTALKVLSSMALRGVLREIAARYACRTSRAVALDAAGGVDVAARVEAGDAADVVVLASDAIDALIDHGKLKPGSRVDLAGSGIAMAVRAGQPKPDIGSEGAVMEAVLAAPALSYSTGPSGVHLRGLIERWGILGDIQSRIVVPPPGVPVGDLLARGTVAIGFQQMSELSNAAGIEVVGLLPPAIQRITIFSGGVSSASGDFRAARALLKFMASPEVSDIKRRHGLEAR